MIIDSGRLESRQRPLHIRLLALITSLPSQRLQIVLIDSPVKLSVDGALAPALYFERLVTAKVKGIPMMTWISNTYESESGPLPHLVLCTVETELRRSQT